MRFRGLIGLGRRLLVIIAGLSGRWRRSGRFPSGCADQSACSPMASLGGRNSLVDIKCIILVIIFLLFFFILLVVLPKSPLRLLRIILIARLGMPLVLELLLWPALGSVAWPSVVLLDDDKGLLLLPFVPS